MKIDSTRAPDAGESSGRARRAVGVARAFCIGHGTYFLAMGAAGAAGLLKSVCYGLILSPGDFGRLSLVTSMVPFLIYGLGRGAVEGAALDLPRLYGLGRVDEAALLLRRCVRRLSIEGAVAAAVAFVAYAIDRRAGLFCLAMPLAGSSAILALVMSDARSRGAMSLYGGSVLGRAIACAALGLPGAALFGLSGAVFGEVVGQTLLVIWLFRSVRETSTDVPAAGLSETRARGWKMMQHQLLQMLQQNADKWIVSAALGPAMLGQYSFAGIFLVAVSLLHAMLYQQIGPSALRSLAEGRAIEQVLGRCHRIALAAGVGIALLGVGAGAAYWWGLRSWFAPYAQGFGIFPWVVLTGVFQIMLQHDWIISTGKRLGTLVKCDALVTLSFFGLAGIGWTRHWPLAYFAVVACAVRAAGVIAVVYLANLTRFDAKAS